ncbi:PF03729 repeat protein [Leptospira broomii serovar Hurstbridge str. 5399]|uniref:PF03729 repeat protein n=1 Tax=Leptospira broomii serovar Hurstbridge str. 5399 TaxID=1049789 RepID=T0F995_9LEPT|nr:DUF308 domain-containing protein [Leptospira broomii]EQA44481.1 PF03729 repeat protein [Leptospira broomii serovar Hurstbridge str. 5399]
MNSLKPKAAKHWWIHVIVGILWIGVGIVTLFFPIQSYFGLSMAFSMILAMTGLFQISFAISNRNRFSGWGWSLALGILDIIVGSVLLFHPEITAITLPFILGFWLVFRGVTLISFALEVRSIQSYPWGWLLFSGIATILFALGILFFPLLGMFTILIWAGAGFMIAGFGNMYLGWKEWKA